jgi:hypothetical protein
MKDGVGVEPGGMRRLGDHGGGGLRATGVAECHRHEGDAEPWPIE